MPERVSVHTSQTFYGEMSGKLSSHGGCEEAPRMPRSVDADGLSRSCGPKVQSTQSSSRRSLNQTKIVIHRFHHFRKEMQRWHGHPCPWSSINSNAEAQSPQRNAENRESGTLLSTASLAERGSTALRSSDRCDGLYRLPRTSLILSPGKGAGA